MIGRETLMLLRHYLTVVADAANTDQAMVDTTPTVTGVS